MQVRYDGPIKTVVVVLSNRDIVARRGEVIDVSEEIGQQLIKQNIWSEVVADETEVEDHVEAVSEPEPDHEWEANE